MCPYPARDKIFLDNITSVISESPKAFHKEPSVGDEMAGLVLKLRKLIRNLNMI